MSQRCQPRTLRCQPPLSATIEQTAAARMTHAASFASGGMVGKGKFIFGRGRAFRRHSVSLRRVSRQRVVPLRFVRGDRQLQHGRVLPFAQLRQQDNFAVGKLQGIMMNV